MGVRDSFEGSGRPLAKAPSLRTLACKTARCRPGDGGMVGAHMRFREPVEGSQADCEVEGIIGPRLMGSRSGFYRLAGGGNDRGLQRPRSKGKVPEPRASSLEPRALEGVAKAASRATADSSHR